MGKHTQAYHQISFFNPAYCLQPLTTTTKEVLPQKCSRDSFTFSSGRHHLHTSYHDFNNNNPSSPKIGCMGQIKIKRDNKLSIWPWMTPSTTRSSSSNNGSSSRKFLKLGRVFSSRSLISPRVSSSSEKVDDVYRVNTVISVSDMDPPLPVVKNVPNETNPASSSTLWKRRRGREINDLEGLQISGNNSMSVCATTVLSCAS